MKKIILGSLLIAGSAQAGHPALRFKGNWQGPCSLNAKKDAVEMGLFIHENSFSSALKLHHYL